MTLSLASRISIFAMSAAAVLMTWLPTVSIAPIA